MAVITPKIPKPKKALSPPVEYQPPYEPEIPDLPTFADLIAEFNPPQLWSSEQASQQKSLVQTATNWAIARGVTPSASWLERLGTLREPIEYFETDTGWILNPDETWTSPEGMTYTRDEMLQLMGEGIGVSTVPYIHPPSFEELVAGAEYPQTQALTPYEQLLGTPPPFQYVPTFEDIVPPLGYDIGAQTQIQTETFQIERALEEIYPYATPENISNILYNYTEEFLAELAKRGKTDDNVALLKALFPGDPERGIEPISDEDINYIFGLSSTDVYESQILAISEKYGIPVEEITIDAKGYMKSEYQMRDITAATDEKYGDEVWYREFLQEWGTVSKEYLRSGATASEGARVIITGTGSLINALGGATGWIGQKIEAEGIKEAGKAVSDFGQVMSQEVGLTPEEWDEVGLMRIPLQILQTMPFLAAIIVPSFLLYGSKRSLP